MEICFIYVLSIIISIFWAFLWIATFKTITVKRFLIHTIVFLLFSVLISGLALSLIFLPADNTYSASNLGALGMVFLVFLGCFIPGCIIAFAVTLGQLLTNSKNDK